MLIMARIVLCLLHKHLKKVTSMRQIRIGSEYNYLHIDSKTKGTYATIILYCDNAKIELYMDRYIKSPLDMGWWSEASFESKTIIFLKRIAFNRLMANAENANN